MHAFVGRTCTIHHDGGEDGSGVGNVIIDTRDGRQVSVQARDLFDFVGEQMKSQMVSRVEQMRGRDFLYAQNGPG